ncbi:MAG: PPC domain-containing DNA-binding protein [Tepidiformaceae bacterium]
MKHRKLGAEGEEQYVLICETGDEPVKVLERFAREHELTSASLTAIGAFERVSLGYYDLEKQEYATTDFNEQLEVVSFIGDISLNDGEPMVHVHVALGRRDCSLLGGHLMSGVVRPTLEIMLSKTPASLVRKYDRASGLSLISIE